jgi:hypothetical protein
VYQNLLFHVYMKFNMFRATHRPSSGAQTTLAASGFAYVKGCWTLWLLDADSPEVHTEIANKMQQCIKMYYSMFIWSSTCFGRHTAHHRELKTALAASAFAYVKGCWTLRLLDASCRSHWWALHTAFVKCGVNRFDLLLRSGLDGRPPPDNR